MESTHLEAYRKVCKMFNSMGYLVTYQTPAWCDLGGDYFTVTGFGQSIQNLNVYELFLMYTCLTSCKNS